MVNIKVAILNLRMNNISSVSNALDYLGFQSEILEASRPMDEYSHLILPGVGAYHEAKKELSARGYDELILNFVKTGKPLLGICLGMQLLSTLSEEFGVTQGLNLIPGDVLKIASGKLPLPHVGWNDVQVTRSHPLWKGLSNPTFYFIHSYAYKKIDENHVLGTSEYGEKIVAAVQKDNVLGVQFHPEKSQKDGLQLLKNFIELC